MSESRNNHNAQLELKIENMLDKLIETDEELENNEDSSSLTLMKTKIKTIK